MLRVLPATIVDLDALESLEMQVFDHDRFSRRQFRHLLTKAHGITLKAQKQNNIIGYMTLLTRTCSHTMKIHSLAVDKNSQKCGVGTLLLRQAERVAANYDRTSLKLEVSEDNPIACRLYLSHGYTLQGRRPHYYQNGSAALTMKKNLANLEHQP